MEIFLFVCVFFWNKKYVSSYTFELCRRVGDRNILNGRFPETRLLFFGLKGFQSWKRVLDIIQKRFQKSFPRMNLKPSSKLWNNWICFLPICLTWDHSEPQFWFKNRFFFHEDIHFQTKRGFKNNLWNKPKQTWNCWKNLSCISPIYSKYNRAKSHFVLENCTA